MHLLIVAIGSAGDVYPFLSIGRAAVARGHRVTLCTSPAFRDLVDQCGLTFRAIGAVEDYTRVMDDPALWNPRTSLKVLWKTIAATLFPVYDLLLEHLDGETVMLGSLWAFSARVVQEKFRVPYLCAQVSPSTLLSAVAPPEHGRATIPAWWPLAARRAALYLAETLFTDRLMRPALNRLRRAHGLPPASRLISRWMHSPDGVVALFPSWFAPRQPDWPAPLSFVGFPLFQHPGDPALDAQLMQFLNAGAPPLVLTAGSTPTTKDFLERALQAIRMTGRRAVVLAQGAVALPSDDTVLLRRYVPLPALLARSAAIWHHGGIGTTALAIRAGLPHFVTPFAHDQFDNARRIVGLGIGVRCQPQASAGEFSGALRGLLGDELILAACRQLQERACTDSGEAACDRVVDLAEACAAACAAASASRASRMPNAAVGALPVPSFNTIEHGQPS